MKYTVQVNGTFTIDADDDRTAFDVAASCLDQGADAMEFDRVADNVRLEVAKVEQDEFHD